MVGTKTIYYTKSCLLWDLWPWSWSKCSIKLPKFFHFCLYSDNQWTKHDEPDKQAPVRCDPLHIRYSAPSRDLHIAPLLLLLLLRKPPPSHRTPLWFIHSPLSHIIYIYILFSIFTQLGLCYFLSFRSWAPTSWCFLCVMMVQSHWAYQTCLVSLWGPWCLLWLPRLFPLSFSLCLIFPKARYVWIESTI